jgi:hypothetical protein
MSRIFRRPMFRKGGGANMNGIMSGIEDRQNYQDAGRVGELTKEYTSQLGANAEDKGFDPLTTFLLQYGPQVAGQTGGGNLIGNLLLAAEKPVQNIIENQAERRKYLRDLKAGATELAIKQAGQESLLEKKLTGQRELAEMELGALGTTDFKDYLEQYQGSSVQAKNRADYENQGLESKAVQNFGESYEGFIGGIHGKTKDYEKKGNIGKVYYDVTDGTFKRLRKTADGYSYESINMASFDPEADKAKVIPKEKFPGEKSETPGYRRPPKEFSIKPTDPFDPYGGA